MAGTEIEFLCKITDRKKKEQKENVVFVIQRCAKNVVVLDKGLTGLSFFFDSSGPKSETLCEILFIT